MADKRKPKNPDIDVFHQRNFSAGIANFSKEDNNPYAYAYSQCIDTRTNPFGLKLLPATVKESSSVVTNLVKWFDVTPENLDTYGYDAAGKLYKRTTAGAWSTIATLPNSHGNGLAYFYGDDYLYAACDKVISRYGPIAAASPTVSNDFLTAQGGVPTNTASLVLAASSSQYAHAADSPTLDITSDLTLETFFKAASLPAVGSSMTLVGKWDEAANHRSYKLDIYGISGFFGTGADGPLTLTVNTTDAPIDSACSGTLGTNQLSANNASFVVGQRILIIQMQGSGAGSFQETTIQGYDNVGHVISTADNLNFSYNTSGNNTAQVLAGLQYTNITINGGVVWKPKAWNGSTGGILYFFCNGTLTNNGQIYGTGLGFRSNVVTGSTAQGEGSGGVPGFSTAQNGDGAGGGQNGQDSGHVEGAGGGGGGNANAGSNGTSGTAPRTPGTGGSAVGSADLTTMLLGGAGGWGGDRFGPTSSGDQGSQGGNGGAMFFGSIVTFINNGSINFDGVDGLGTGATHAGGTGGGGAGGSFRARVQTVSGSGTITANQGNAAASGGNGGTGGNGSVGYIVVDYLISSSISASPTANQIQDNTLVTTTTYQARLGISDDGTSFEYLTKNLNNLTTGTWNRLSVVWVASTSTARFYLTGTLLGSTVGLKTSIASNASLLTVGANNSGSGIGNYFDGKLNDMRIIANAQSGAQIAGNCFVQLSATYAGLAAYYTFNSVYTDTTANANGLTPVNTPVFDTADVPFPNATTRLDIDQSYTTNGQTYALKAAISEATADKLPFTPSFDPQKSVDFDIASVGSAPITVTVHDQQNNVIASVTTPLASLPASGFYEFVFSTSWRIVIGKQYHIHVTQSSADGTLVSSSNNNLATAVFHTYYGFLVTDTQFHPITRMLNFIVFGNERYLATWDGAFYQPNLIAFPPGTHVRCFGSWGAYLAVGTWQEPASTTPSIYNFPTGKIYFWDGISLTFNFYIEVPEGQVNAIFGMDADLYYIAGYKADLLYYHGSFANQSGSFNGTKVKRIPYLETNCYIDTFPQAMCMYQGLLYFALGGNSDSVAFPRNIYSWGTLYPQYAQSLSSDYIISTGHNGNTVQLGAIFPINKKLLVSWQDGIAYGVDVIDPAGPLYKSGYIQTLIQDGGAMWRQDLLTKSRADFLGLTGAQNVIIGQQMDRSGSFDASHSGVDNTKRYAANPLENGRCYEYNLQATLTGDGTSSPTLLSITGVTNPLDSEDQI